MGNRETEQVMFKFYDKIYKAELKKIYSRKERESDE